MKELEAQTAKSNAERDQILVKIKEQQAAAAELRAQVDELRGAANESQKQTVIDQLKKKILVLMKQKKVMIIMG